MLLALFLIDLAAGLVVFLPFVGTRARGRRNAGVNFYRMVFIISAALAACAAFAHARAGARELAIVDAVPVALTIFVWFVLRYPKRVVFRVPAALLGASYIAASVAAWRAGTQAPPAWGIARARASVALARRRSPAGIPRDLCPVL